MPHKQPFSLSGAVARRAELPDGRIEMFTLPGFHPKYGMKLVPATPQAVAEYDKQKAAAEPPSKGKKQQTAAKGRAGSKAKGQRRGRPPSQGSSGCVAKTAARGGAQMRERKENARRGSRDEKSGNYSLLPPEKFHQDDFSFHRQISNRKSTNLDFKTEELSDVHPWRLFCLHRDSIGRL